MISCRSRTFLRSRRPGTSWIPVSLIATAAFGLAKPRRFPSVDAGAGNDIPGTILLRAIRQFSPGFDAGRANQSVQLRENYSNMLVAHANSVNAGNVW